MTSKRSRYYKLDVTAFPDSRGIERQSKALRRTQTAAGQFLHALEASDRLDHLAYKYYRQSLHWWRICDANPQFADPLALLGKTPVTGLHFYISWSGGVPPLATLYAALRNVSGIERVLKDSAGGLPDPEIADNAPLFALPGAVRPLLDAAVLSQTLPAALALDLQAQGVVLAGLYRFSRPQTDLWHIEQLADATLYRLRYTAATGLVTVNKGARRYRIELLVFYNRDSVTQQSIVNAIAGLGFSVDETEAITRIGQSIVIPPRYTGRD